MKSPSLEARADRAVNDRAEQIGLLPAVDEALERSWRDGFAAALAMLREPSEGLLTKAGTAILTVNEYRGPQAEFYKKLARAALAAAADAMGEKADG
jgi:hypothetical protein